ncbi:MAG: hypothetical protein Kow001_13980 [Acidobacteriota bacterium]
MEQKVPPRPLTRHSIGFVSRRTGLKPDVIRAWERRYQAVAPGRTATNRRYYTDEEIERLSLLRKVTLAGRQIGQVCHLSTEDLRQLAAEDEEALARVPHRHAPVSSHEGGADGRSEACLAAIENLDPQALQYQLDQAAVEMSPPQVIQQVLTPLLDRIGGMWEAGTLRVAHEHMASSVISAFLAGLLTSYGVPEPAPVVVVGTPSRQFHELGALMAAASAAAEGWRPLYLGSNLPVEELAAAVRQKAARLLAISLVYPADDPLLERELLRLRRLVGDDVRIVIGGRAVPAYRAAVDRIGGIPEDDMVQFRRLLRSFRSPH